MKTPEPLSTERLYALCAQAKVSTTGTVIIWRDELLALVEMAKERNELLSEESKPCSKNS